LRSKDTETLRNTALSITWANSVSDNYKFNQDISANSQSWWYWREGTTSEQMLCTFTLIQLYTQWTER